MYKRRGSMPASYAGPPAVKGGAGVAKAAGRISGRTVVAA
jgi:hypothetical protein